MMTCHGRVREADGLPPSPYVPAGCPYRRDVDAVDLGPLPREGETASNRVFVLLSRRADLLLLSAQEGGGL